MTPLIGHPVVDEDGAKVGVVRDVVCDAYTLEPRWLSIKIGLLKGSRLVPVDLVDDDGATSLVHTTKRVVSTAPQSEVAGGPPSKPEAATLRVHYGLSPSEDRVPPPPPPPRRRSAAERRPM